MRKRGNIMKYTAEELAAMEARGEDRTDWAAVAAKTEEELAADMAGDAAWDGVPTDWVGRAHAATRLMLRPEENKRQVTMRLAGIFQARRARLAGPHECRAPQFHGAPGTWSLKSGRGRIARITVTFTLLSQVTFTLLSQ
jgi:hypothetical protein